MSNDVSDYYDAMTAHYLNYGGSSFGWHFGLWDETTSTVSESLLRSNALLAETAGMRPGDVVLDAGCGVGGLGVFLAEEYGVRVIGVTICESHVELANALAAERGIEGLTEFRYGDFMSFDFADQTFDHVVNQETFCYASDKNSYLEGVHRVLRRGGSWIALDGFRSTKTPSPELELLHMAAQQGWRMPPLTCWQQVPALLAETGFIDTFTVDVTPMARPSLRQTMDHVQWFHDNYVTSDNTPASAAMIRQHVDACAGFAGGLLDDYFTYHLVGGRKA